MSRAGKNAFTPAGDGPFGKRLLRQKPARPHRQSFVAFIFRIRRRPIHVQLDFPVDLNLAKITAGCTRASPGWFVLAAPSPTNVPAVMAYSRACHAAFLLNPSPILTAPSDGRFPGALPPFYRRSSTRFSNRPMMARPAPTHPLDSRTGRGACHKSPDYPRHFSVLVTSIAESSPNPYLEGCCLPERRNFKANRGRAGPKRHFYLTKSYL